MITPDKVQAIYRSRKAFYNGLDIYWWEFKPDIRYVIEILLPKSFLRVADTPYFECGSDLQAAIKQLTDAGFSKIIQGDEL